MNKDVFVVVMFLAMTFLMTYGGHVLFKKGYLVEWALEKQINNMHPEAIDGHKEGQDH